MNARQSARQLCDALDPRRALRPEHIGQWIDAGSSDADVVDGDAGLAGFLDRVRSVGPRIAAFVAVVRDQAVTDHDQHAPLRRLILQSPGQMPQRSAESGVATGGEAQRTRHHGIRVREVAQARYFNAMTRVASEYEQAVALSRDRHGVTERVGARELELKDRTLMDPERGAAIEQERGGHVARTGQEVAEHPRLRCPADAGIDVVLDV